MEFSNQEYWVAIPFTRGSSPPMDRTPVSLIAGRFFTGWATRKTPLVSAMGLCWEVLFSGLGHLSCPFMPGHQGWLSPLGSPLEHLCHLWFTVCSLTILGTPESGVVVVQSLNRVWLFATPWTAARQASLSFTISWSLLKLMSIESMMPSNHFILCRPLLLLPSIFPSIRVFSKEPVLRIR